MIKDKKMFLKKYTKLLITIFLIFGISIVIEIIGFNFNILKLDNSERISQKIELKKDNSNTISLEKKGFINKIKISYSSTNDFNIIINYKCKNVYNKDETKQLVAPSSYKLGITIENINCNIKDLNISTDNTEVEIIDLIIDNEFKINYYRVIYIFIVILIFFMLIVYRNSFLKNLENKFLIISLGIGMLIIFLMPNSTFYSYDDETHFKNSIGFTDFFENKITDSMNQMEYALPFPFNTITTFEEIGIQNNYLNVNHGDNIIDHVRNKYSLNTLSYLPVGLSLYLLNVIDVPFVVMFKLAKLVNLLFYVVVCYFAIKKIKIFKRLFFVLALIPTSLYMACNYSYDSVLTSCILFSIASIINNYVDEKNNITLKRNILPFVITLYGMIIKAVYAPLILIGLFIPKNKFKNKKENRNYKLTILLVFIILMSTFVLPTIISPSKEGDYRVENTSVSTQMDIILDHPIGYAQVLKDNALNNFFDKFLGNQTLIEFGYLGTTKGNLYYLILFIIIFVAITDKYNQKKQDFSIKFLLINFISIIGTITLIWTALYLSFNEVGSTFIGGVQWRYFIPILPSLLIIINRLSNIKNEFDIKKYDIFISMILYIILVLCIYNFIIYPIHL